MELTNATMADAEFLFAIRNDPVTRAMSRGEAPIDWQAHVQWPARMIDDSNCALYVARAPAPVGSGRSDKRDGGAELSWTIAPAQRGKRLGTELLAQLIQRAPAGALVAHIKSDNAPSLALAARHQFAKRAAADGLETWVRIKPAA